MSTMENIVEPQTSRGRRTLIMVVLAFAAPIVFALLFWSFWRPSGFGNHGDLVQPPRVLQSIRLATLDGKPFDLHVSEPKWTLVYFDPGDCTERCQQSLYNMRQVRLGQGKNTYRVRTVLIVRTPRESVAAAINDSLPSMLVLTGSTAEVDAVASQFITELDEPFSTSGRFYLVDPLNNLMMSFSPQLDPRDVLKDLKHLLKVSQIG